ATPTNRQNQPRRRLAAARSRAIFPQRFSPPLHAINPAARPARGWYHGTGRRRLQPPGPSSTAAEETAASASAGELVHSAAGPAAGHDAASRDRRRVGSLTASARSPHGARTHWRLWSTTPTQHHHPHPRSAAL